MSPLVITAIGDATAAEWDQAWQQCAYATYFQSREWATLWQTYTQNQFYPAPKRLIFSDGQQAVVPFSIQRLFRGLVQCKVLSPAGTFGGWLAPDSLTPEHSQALQQYLLSQTDLVWRINPYAPSLGDGLSNASSGHWEPDETHVLPLSSSIEALYQTWKTHHSSLIRNIKKARQSGIQICLAETLSDWQTYYQVYELSLLRWGSDCSSRYGWELFYALYQQRSAATKLWLALYQGRVIAGALCFYATAHVVYWHGAALSDYFNLRPVHLLMADIIADACTRGYQWFDFNPSGGHDGVKEFKQRFGAESRPCPIIKIESTQARFFNHVKQTIPLSSRI
jgi:hypothetical protein